MTFIMEGDPQPEFKRSTTNIVGVKVLAVKVRSTRDGPNLHPPLIAILRSLVRVCGRNQAEPKLEGVMVRDSVRGSCRVTPHYLFPDSSTSFSCMCSSSSSVFFISACIVGSVFTHKKPQ